MFRYIAIAIALVVLTAVLVLYHSAVDQQGEMATEPHATGSSAIPVVESTEDSSIGVVTEAEPGSFSAASDISARSGDTALMRKSSAPVTARPHDPAAVVADMSSDGQIIAIRPPSGGPSIIDAGLPGPNPSASGSDTTDFAVAVPEMSQPVATTETPTSPGPGPAETDLQLPGPGESSD